LLASGLYGAVGFFRYKHQILLKVGVGLYQVVEEVPQLSLRKRLTFLEFKLVG
jgi:hypothetical protein